MMARVKVILAHIPTFSGAMRELEDAVRETGHEARDLFKLSASSWEHEPGFNVVMDIRSNRIAVLVYTDDEIYRYVSRGTKPHIIRPKHAKRLAFNVGYVAKTIPGIIVTRGGGTAGGDLVFAGEVHHPGTEPRNFPTVIAKEIAPNFKRRMGAAMSKFARQLHQ